MTLPCAALTSAGKAVTLPNAFGVRRCQLAAVLIRSTSEYSSFELLAAS